MRWRCPTCVPRSITGILRIGWKTNVWKTYAATGKLGGQAQRRCDEINKLAGSLAGPANEFATKSVHSQGARPPSTGDTGPTMRSTLRMTPTARLRRSSQRRSRHIHRTRRRSGKLCSHDLRSLCSRRTLWRHRSLWRRRSHGHRIRAREAHGHRCFRCR